MDPARHRCKIKIPEVVYDTIGKYACDSITVEGLIHEVAPLIVASQYWKTAGLWERANLMPQAAWVWLQARAKELDPAEVTRLERY